MNPKECHGLSYVTDFSLCILSSKLDARLVYGVGRGLIVKTGLISVPNFLPAASFRMIFILHRFLGCRTTGSPHENKPGLLSGIKPMRFHELPPFFEKKISTFA